MKRIVYWHQYENLMSELYGKVKENNIDFIVCVGRGGFLIGDYLSRRCQKPLGVVMASSYSDQTNEQGELEFTGVCSINEVFGKILIVDDLVDSGKTLKEIASSVFFGCPKVMTVNTASIWCKENAQFKPNYFVESCPADEWIIQPFELVF